jgi:peptidoglycan-associated lipoprotein
MLQRLIFVSIVATSIFLASCGMNAHKAYTIAQQKFKQGEYEHAIEYYKMAIEKGIRHPKTDKVNFQIGESYRLSNRILEATEFYQKSVDAGGEQDSANYFYAVGLESQGKYGEAENQFLKYSETGRNPELAKKAKIEYDNLKLIEPILKKQAEFELKNMGGLNTSGGDWCPLVFKDDIYFSTARGQSKVHTADGQGFNDIYKFKYDGVSDSSGVAQPIGSKVNYDDTHDACPSLSKDGKTLYFARSNDGSAKGHKDVGIFVSKYREGEWQEATKLSFCEDTSWYSTPWLAADQKTLYFSSNRPGGQGGLDIWYSKLENDIWGPITNAGDKINTHGNEYSPSFSPSGKFYFASSGHPGLGSLDLFEVNKNESGVDVVENMGLPYNSVSDDFGIVWANDTLGYMTSDREGGKGEDDIYLVRQIPKSANYTQTVIVYGVNPKTNRERLLKNAHVLITGVKGDTIYNGKTDEEGKIVTKVNAQTKYDVEARKHKHYNHHEIAVTPNATPRAQLKKGMNDIVFEKPIIIKLNEITLDPIRLELYYDYNKWDIRPDAAKILDSLVDHMKQNPEIVIELSSHTDSRGKDAYNLKLSQNRAKSAVDYVIGHGIDPKMISAKGEGETRPLVTPEKDDRDYQLNRRTEVRVVRILDLEE